VQFGWDWAGGVNGWKLKHRHEKSNQPSIPFPGASRGRDAAPQQGFFKAGYRGVKLTLLSASAYL
jgi:hypothetical protein